MRIVSECTESKFAPSYFELKKTYNTEVVVPSVTSTDVFLDTIEMLDDRGLRYEVYFNTTNDGCSIFYDETELREAPNGRTCPPQLSYSEIRKLISGIAYSRYDKSIAPAKIAQFNRILGYDNGQVAVSEQDEFMRNLKTLAHGLTKQRIIKFIGEHL